MATQTVVSEHRRFCRLPSLLATLVKCNKDQRKSSRQKQSPPGAGTRPPAGRWDTTVRGRPLEARSRIVASHQSLGDGLVPATANWPSPRLLEAWVHFLLSTGQQVSQPAVDPEQARGLFATSLLQEGRGGAKQEAKAGATWLCCSTRYTQIGGVSSMACLYWRCGDLGHHRQGCCATELSQKGCKRGPEDWSVCPHASLGGP